MGKQEVLSIEGKAEKRKRGVKYFKPPVLPVVTD